MSPLPALLDRNEVREAVLGMVVGNVAKVLDLTCGDGSFGAALKERFGCRVTGVEPVPELVATARGRLDEVVLGNPERVALPYPPKTFDIVIAMGTFEMVVDPWKMAGLAAQWLKPKGLLIAGVSNPVNLGFLEPALHGGWTYGDPGKLDRSRIRLVTRETLDEIVSSAGFKTISALTVPDPQAVVATRVDGNVEGSDPVTVTFGVLGASVQPSRVAELTAAGFVVVAQRPPMPDIYRPVQELSIVTAVHNQASEMTRLLTSLTRIPQEGSFEIVVVDNASTDAVAKLVSTDDGSVVVLHNDEDRGVVRAFAQSTRHVHSKVLAFLDPGIEVGSGFVGDTSSIFEQDRSIGAVVPLVLSPSGKVDSAGLDVTGEGETAVIANPHSGKSLIDAGVSQERELSCVTLGACAVRRTAYEMVQGLDTDLVEPEHAGVDLARRLVAEEWRVVYVPTIRVVRHPVAGGT